MAFSVGRRLSMALLQNDGHSETGSRRLHVATMPQCVFGQREAATERTEGNMLIKMFNNAKMQPNIWIFEKKIVPLQTI